jgi:uncharacterized protein with HEPN domain
VSPREWRLRVQDILDAISAIQAYTAGMDYAAFAQDRRTVDAVLRNITVIGEAANRIPGEIQADSPEIPWADMRDTRNVVVHEYFGVNRQILWDTTQTDLPPLVAQLHGLLERTP